jgi:DNA polymerase III subunit epsilon
VWLIFHTGFNFEGKMMTLFRDVVQGKFRVIDFETTGIGNADEIVSVAIIDETGAKLLYTLLKPSISIPWEATDVHGITDAMVANSPSFVTVRDEIYALLRGQFVVSYNAKFERRMLHQTAANHQMSPVVWKEVAQWYCAMEAFAEINGEWDYRRKAYKWKNLGYACARYGRIFEQHDALADCRATLFLVGRMFAR